MNIVVTGSNGFLGRHLVSKLRQRGFDPYEVRSKTYDLRTQLGVDALFKHTGEVDILYHLAATIGGIGENMKHSGRFFYDNMLMGINVINAAMVHEVGKTVVVGTTCSYPKHCPTPFMEGDLFNGYPEETNAPYGIAKRALWTMLDAYHKEYGLDFTYLVPSNMYGPGDNFKDSGHVIPALIRKCLQAKQDNSPYIEVWGTGLASRDFVYVEDVADALVLAIEADTGPAPINLGSGIEIRIEQLVKLVTKATEYDGGIRWDMLKPDGQPRRCLDTRRAKEMLGWEAMTDLPIGLDKTVEWYVRSR